MTGGLPDSTHAHLAPSTPHLVLHSSRQIVGEAHRVIGKMARLVLHGVEFEAERYGLAAAGSVMHLTAWDSPLAPESLVANKSWNDDVIRAARILKWPASSLQWWVAPLLSADCD